MTLREKLIGALWCGFNLDSPKAEYRDMADALDEMLDCLAEHSEEWKRITYAAYPTTDSDDFGSAAIAALRGTKEVGT